MVEKVDLIQRYFINICSDILSGEKRKYHNIYHIYNMIGNLDQYHAKFPLTHTMYEKIRLAIWGHDVIYSVPSSLKPTNERASANITKSLLFNCGLDEGFIESVSNLILATEYSTKPVGQKQSLFEHNLIRDLDLVGLGYEYEVFEINSKNVLREAALLDGGKSSEIKDEHRKSQIGFFKSILDKKILHTNYFSSIYEEKAKENLKKYIFTYGENY